MCNACTAAGAIFAYTSSATAVYPYDSRWMESLTQVSNWSYNGSIMALNLSIKGVPVQLVERLRRRAERHHRSLQGELMTILEEALGASPAVKASKILKQLRESGLSTGPESVSMIREDRDER